MVLLDQIYTVMEVDSHGQGRKRRYLSISPSLMVADRAVVYGCDYNNRAWKENVTRAILRCWTRRIDFHLTSIQKDVRVLRLYNKNNNNRNGAQLIFHYFNVSSRAALIYLHKWSAQCCTAILQRVQYCNWQDAELILSVMVFVWTKFPSLWIIRNSLLGRVFIISYGNIRSNRWITTENSFVNDTLASILSGVIKLHVAAAERRVSIEEHKLALISQYRIVHCWQHRLDIWSYFYWMRS